MYTPRYDPERKALIVNDDTLLDPTRGRCGEPVELEVRSAADARAFLDLGVIKDKSVRQLAAVFGYALEFMKSPGKRTHERLMSTLMPHEDPTDDDDLVDAMSELLVPVMPLVDGTKINKQKLAQASNAVKLIAFERLTKVTGVTADK